MPSDLINSFVFGLWAGLDVVAFYTLRRQTCRDVVLCGLLWQPCRIGIISPVLDGKCRWVVNPQWNRQANPYVYHL